MGFYGSVTASRSYVESLDEEAKVYLDPSVIGPYYTRLYDVLNQPTSAKKFKDICEALEGSDFITVAEKYRLIEQDMVNLVVPYGEEGRQLMEAVHKIGLNADWSRKAQLYSVAVRRPRPGDPIRDIMEPAPIFKRSERLESEDWFLCTANAKYDELTGLEVPHGNDFCDFCEV